MAELGASAAPSLRAAVARPPVGFATAAGSGRTQRRLDVWKLALRMHSFRVSDSEWAKANLKRKDPIRRKRNSGPGSVVRARRAITVTSDSESSGAAGPGVPIGSEGDSGSGHDGPGRRFQ